MTHLLPDLYTKFLWRKSSEIQLSLSLKAERTLQINVLSFLTQVLLIPLKKRCCFPFCVILRVNKNASQKNFHIKKV